MRLLDDALLSDRYDVIVVGAGLGGMAAAGLLAKRGLSVLMIDQQDKPGGSCTSFRRKDVVFDVGTAMIYGFGERGFKPFRFLLNELEEPIDVVELCQRRCHRRTFAGEPVRIAELERWVCEAAGPGGWPRPDLAGEPWRVAVVEAAISRLSCAFYLALSGCRVDLYDEGAQPGDALSRMLPATVPPAALARDLSGVLLPGIQFHAGRAADPGFVEDLRRSHDAVVLGALAFGRPGAAGLPQAGLPTSGSPGTFRCGSPGEGQTVAEAAAAGRRVAVEVCRSLAGPEK